MGPPSSTSGIDPGLYGASPGVPIDIGTFPQADALYGQDLGGHNQHLSVADGNQFALITRQPGAGDGLYDQTSPRSDEAGTNASQVPESSTARTETRNHDAKVTLYPSKRFSGIKDDTLILLSST